MSSAPQNEEPIHTLATSANTPKPVDESRIRASARVSVASVALGNSCWRSDSTLASRSGLSSTRPAMNRASSASGNTDSSRL